MKKFSMLVAILIATFSTLIPVKADSATVKMGTIVKKKIVLQGTYTNYQGYVVNVTYRTGTNTVIAVESPDGDILGYSFTSATATILTITMTDFLVNIDGHGVTDASGVYTVY